MKTWLLTAANYTHYSLRHPEKQATFPILFSKVCGKSMSGLTLFLGLRQDQAALAGRVPRCRGRLWGTWSRRCLLQIPVGLYHSLGEEDMLDTVHGQTLPEKCDVAPQSLFFGILYEWSCSFFVAGCAGSWFHVASSGCGCMGLLVLRLVGS